MFAFLFPSARHRGGMGDGPPLLPLPGCAAAKGGLGGSAAAKLAGCELRRSCRGGGALQEPSWLWGKIPLESDHQRLRNWKMNTNHSQAGSLSWSLSYPWHSSSLWVSGAGHARIQPVKPQAWLSGAAQVPCCGQCSFWWHATRHDPKCFA